MNVKLLIHSFLNSMNLPTKSLQILYLHHNIGNILKKFYSVNEASLIFEFEFSRQNSIETFLQIFKVQTLLKHKECMKWIRGI